MAKIIAADDDIYLQRIYYYMLDGLGHDTTICCNGEEAVQAFKDHGADLVILDISMPIMDGLDACRQIKQTPQGASTPVIIVSGNDKEEEITQGFNAGADDYMLKPIQENILVAKLKNFLKTASLNRKEFELVKHHTLLADRYRIEKVLGYGAHSVVFLATDSQANGLKVAVKLLNEQVADEDIRRCFVAMVTQFRALSSPNIAKITDHGVFNNQLYIIMDYAPGGNLRQRITVKKFDETEVCQLGRQMIAALEQLAVRDLTHLDIKPENILCRDDNYQLTDFGLVIDKASGTMPLQAEIWSTAAYICPEYLEGITNPTIKSDVYSLGLTLFETVTGDNPFFAGRATVSMFRQVNLIPPYLSNQAEGISYELSDVIAAMMSKDPGARPDLQTIKQWFDFILQCHAEGTATEQLKYPRRGEQRKLVAAQESAMQRRHTILKVPRRKTWIELKIERMGQIAYNFIMMQEHRGLVGKITLARKIAYAGLVMVTFTYLSYSALAAFRYEAGKAAEAPLCRLACTNAKCANLEDHKVKNIRQEKCSRCGSKMGYALQCQSCKKKYPWFKPNISSDVPEKTRQLMLKKSMACVFCKSTQTIVVPPDPPKQPPKGKAAEPEKTKATEPAKTKGK